ACRRAGALHVDGRQLAVDRGKAAALFDLGCTSGDADACAALADLYRQRNQPGDLLRAITLYDRACSASVAHGCLQAGNLYRKAGRDDTAQQRYDQGCRAGSAEACHLMR
ncbi:MAG TPA: hypothetical protein VHW23_45130, partial [Kofleriaceae bacterium]|nr:hypothetical protein [Kofleriaceae bacterium]